MDIHKNKPFTNNSISNEKPNVARSMNTLTGYVANSFNAGINKTIAYKKVMAGERHKEYRLKAKFQMLTPLTPTYQNLTATIRTYFVPNSRVWTNAEQYTAQKKTPTEEKITEIPNLYGKLLYNLAKDDGETQTYYNVQESSIWRDCWVSSYIPKVANYNQPRSGKSTSTIALPKINALPLRGRIAIYNDFERNKEYDEALQEFKGDTVSVAEWTSYLPFNTSTEGNLQNINIDTLIMRARRNNSYYSDYRVNLQGLDADNPELDDNTRDLTDWIAWENLISEARSEAENAQKNPWDIIAQIRGSKKLTEGKVQLIGQKSFNLNYAAITQNTYNNNEEVREEFRVMGKQGAYSYTEIDTSLYAGMQFNEEGYIHVIITVSADSVYESAYDRMDLNCTPLDEYRPDLVEQKDDVLYEIECTALPETTGTIGNYDVVRGFKRKFSEYFKLPNIIRGDMMNADIYQSGDNTGRIENYFNIFKVSENKIIPNSTFQFFETTDKHIIMPSGSTLSKKYWLDYSDFMVNKNQAIQNEVYKAYAGLNRLSGIIGGQNQIFMVGIAMCTADMPIDEAIKSNYTKWGEH